MIGLDRRLIVMTNLGVYDVVMDVVKNASCWSRSCRGGSVTPSYVSLRCAWNVRPRTIEGRGKATTTLTEWQ